MAYKEVAETVFANDIQAELERRMVFAEFCDRQYEGKLKKVGDAVKIPAIARPTITTTTDGTDPSFGAPEKVQTTSQTLVVNQVSKFNFMVESIEELQSNPKLWDKLKREAAIAMANVKDSHIAAMAADTNIKTYDSAATKVEAANVLTILDYGIQYLAENDVPVDEEVVFECTPRFYNILKSKVISLDTDNSKEIEFGKIARYGNVIIKRSNNVKTANAGATDLCMLRTKGAIAYVDALMKVQTYDTNDDYMGTVMRAISLYQAKVVRPKEVFVANVKYA